MQTAPTIPKDKLAGLLEGILLGRTLHDLEKQAGASVEQLMRLLQTDEDAALALRSAREFSAYVLEDEITDKLRANMENPETAVKNNALKIWADHMHRKLEARNPAIYSGKAAVHMTVPVKIVTDLDLNAPQSIAGIYELKAEVVEERPLEALPAPDFGPEQRPGEAPALDKEFSDALVDAAMDEIIANYAKTEANALDKGPESAGRAGSVADDALSGQQNGLARDKSKVAARKSGAKGRRARAKPVADATIEGAAPK